MHRLLADGLPPLKQMRQTAPLTIGHPSAAVFLQRNYRDANARILYADRKVHPLVVIYFFSDVDFIRSWVAAGKLTTKMN